jgi:solute carrier family 8 (sodium/calcium exchanger)
LCSELGVTNIGFSLLNRYVLIGIYLCLLGYIFLGIGIISDIFMEAIEEITSQTQIKEIKDGSGHVIGTIEEIVWNPTVANLSLMALGSSAPEIMLSVIETITFIEQVPGELGPSTIVGSAAFNLLIISAVSIMAVDEKPKKIDDVNVFAITSMFSILAYLWMFFVLTIWTPEEITFAEAIITLGLTGALVGLAYIADTCRQRSRK